MKRIAIAAFAALISLPALAGQLEEIPDARSWGLRVLAQARAARTAADLGAAAIADNRSARALVIPVTGNAPGANGTHFRSDVTFANWSDEEQHVGVLWLPNGDPSGTRAFRIRVRARIPVTFRDFVGAQLGRQGVGALVVLPLTPVGDFDPDGAIDAYSRIWTAQPGATGTVSQPFPAVEPSFMTGERRAMILGLRQDAEFRTNYGIVNIGENDLPFKVRILAEEGEGTLRPQHDVVVPSLGMIHRPLPELDPFGAVTVSVDVADSVPAGDFTWTTYASSTDNITGDGWVSLGAKPWGDAELDANQ